MKDERLRVLLVGAFRSIVPEGVSEANPFGGQGGFVDTLAPEPYSLANGYLKVFAEADDEVRRGCRISLMNLAEPLFLEDEREEVRLSDEDVEKILGEEPDLIAFSTYCWNLDALRAVTTEIKARRPHMIQIFGGRGTEGDPEKLLRETTALDAIIFGEGELAFREILRRKGKSLGSIDGVLWRDGGRIRGSAGEEASRCVVELDEIPSPYLEGILEPPPNGMMMELSRGCLHACGYCTWSADKRLRHFSSERIEAEIEWALRRGHQHITFNDAAINYDTTRLQAIVAAINHADPKGSIRFTYNVRHDALDDAQLEALSMLPTHMVLLGIESLHASAMAEVSRSPVDVEPLRERLRRLAQATRPPVVSIVLGLPGDSESGFLETLETLLGWTRPDASGRAEVGAVLVSLLQVYRGSALWHRRDELGLRFQEPGIPYLLESPDWPAESLARVKAELVCQIAVDSERLKAAEAIVLMERAGGLDPWLGKRRVRALLDGWQLETAREGWTLVGMGVQRDTGQAVTLRLQSEDGSLVRVALTRRHSEDGTRGPSESRLYRIEVRPVAGTPVSEAARARVLEFIREALLRGEETIARASAARR